jgi:hypothetical protein
VRTPHAAESIFERGCWAAHAPHRELVQERRLSVVVELSEEHELRLHESIENVAHARLAELHHAWEQLHLHEPGNCILRVENVPERGHMRPQGMKRGISSSGNTHSHDCAVETEWPCELQATVHGDGGSGSSSVPRRKCQRRPWSCA